MKMRSRMGGLIGDAKGRADGGVMFHIWGSCKARDSGELVRWIVCPHMELLVGKLEVQGAAF
jgi:hypothetical protein